MERVILEASEGMIYTNGEIYGRKIYLAEGLTSDGFYEINEEEYERIQADEEASIEDYQEALDKLGVK